MGKALLPLADLRGAQLQGALLMAAQLPGADLRNAELQNMFLSLAELQGADLENAKLRGADLLRAKLQGTDLTKAEFQGADLPEAQLQGANLTEAQLQGANLAKAQLKGADLRSAELYGAVIEQTDITLVDLRAARWIPLNEERLAEIREAPIKTIAETEWRQEALDRIERAGNAGVPAPLIGSCPIDPEVTPELKCQRQWLPAEIAAFRSELFAASEKLACQSSWAARGMVRQIDPSERTSGRFRLAGGFAALLDKQECGGLSSLPEADKNGIRDLAKDEEEERRRQSAAGEPAGEVPASPTPPPIATATP